jgi:hypothetical protein
MSIAQNYPTISPSLSLDFANVKKLDSRITFARASSAVAYDGVTVAKAEENLALQSQNLITSWSQFRTARTLNATTAPDGTTTATLVAQAAGTTQPGVILQGMAVTATDYVISIFAKPNGRNFLGVEEGLLDGTNRTTWFNISTGAVGTTYVGHTATITASTNGFYRCSIKLTVNAARSGNFAFYISEFDNNKVTCADDGAGIYMWGAQLEQRDAVTAYTPTTTQPITNYIPTLLSAPANVARFDHNPVTGESLGLLVEEQRTNLLLRSEEFDDAAWASANLINDPNAIIAPDGNLTADGIIENTVSGIHAKSQFPITTIASASYTISVFAKEKIGSKRYLRLSLNSNATNSLWSAATYDLATGEVTSSNGAGGGTVTSTGITPVGNGWFRCVLTGNIGANTDMFAGVSLSSVPTTYTANSRGRQAYLGDGYSGIFIWGAQLEAKQKASSYIKTEASQVTRSAELPSMTGANFTSWFSQGEGTLYVEAQLASTTGRLGTLSVDGNALANGILLDINSGNFRTEGFYNSSGQWAISSAGYVASTDVKQAIVYQTNNVALFANGSQRSSTDVSALIPNDINRFEIGGFGNAKANGHIRKIAFYPKALSATELQALTS